MTADPDLDLDLDPDLDLDLDLDLALRNDEPAHQVLGPAVRLLTSAVRILHGTR